MFTSSRISTWVLGFVFASLLALAFPKTNLTWLAPIALAGLFRLWFASSVRNAPLLGFVTGFVYFVWMFSWFGETAGALVGPLGFITVVLPALLEALFWALAAVLAALAYRRSPLLGPPAAAAAFVLCEWARSTGMMGAPFAQIGYTQVEGPLAAIGAFAGTYGIGFALALVSATVAAATLQPRRWKIAAGAIVLVAVAALATWLLWPARTAAAPMIRVAAIQGNIRQSVKWNSLDQAVSVYTTLTKQALRFHPSFVLWPETVIPTRLNEAPALQQTFSQLAQGGDTTIGVGTQLSAEGRYYNTLWFFTPDGRIASTYRKRQLVPFVEFLPAEDKLDGLPFTGLISRMGQGHDPSVLLLGGTTIAPLICWESAFGDVAMDQARRGAQLLAIATDDAWFGETAGPYQHAQIAQMRAIETGSWVLRAAATGVSGIIAPDGRWTQKTGVDEPAVVEGLVGAAAPAPYRRVGMWPVVAVLALLLVAGLLVPARSR